MAFHVVLGAVLIAVAQAGDQPKVIKLDVGSSSGSLAGGHKIIIIGEGFAKNQFNFGVGSTHLGNAVKLYSTTREYPCNIHKDGCTETRLACYTVAMEPDKYCLKVWVDGVQVTGDNMCKDCCYEPKLSETPTVKSIEPRTGPKGVTVTMRGKIMTTRIDSKNGASTNNKDNLILRLKFGPDVCDPWVDESREKPIGIALEPEEGNDGYIMCKENAKKEFIDNKVVLFMVEDMGNSLTDKAMLRVTAQNTIGMFQSFAEITKISPVEGGDNGGTKITISGMECYSQTTNEVTIGGVECENAVCSGDDLVCSTPQKPAAQTLYKGNRGIKVETWNIAKSLDKLDEVLSLSSSDTGYSASWTDQTHYQYNKSVSGEFVVKLSFFFNPIYDGNHMFMLTSFGGANAYMTDMTDSAGTREKVAYIHTDTNSWWGQTSQSSKYYDLKKNGKYFVEVIHRRKDVNSWVTLAIRTDVAEHFEDDTISVRQEKAKYEITSTVQNEIQELVLESFADEDDWTANVQELDLSSIGGDEDFVIDFMGSKTKSIAAAILSESNLKNALNALPAFATYNKPVTVASNGQKFTITVGVDLGELPNMVVKKKDGSTITAKQITAGRVGKKNVHLNVGGVIVPGFPFNADKETIKSKFEAALGTRCPSDLTNNLGAKYSQDFEKPTTNGVPHGGTRETDPPAYCGRVSMKNLLVLFKDDRGMAISSQEVCFAHRGIFPKYYRYTCEERKLYLETGMDSPTDKEKWMYTCVPLAPLKDLKCETVKEIGFANREQPSEDYYVDTITVMKDGKTTLDGNTDIKSQQLPGALLGGQTVKEVMVEKATSDKIRITFVINKCGHNIPLIKPALHGAVTNAKTKTSMDYSLGSAKITVNRLQAASTNVAGTFKLKYKTKESDFRVDYDADAFASQLSMLGLGVVEVDYQESCHNPSWTATFKSLKGDLEQVEAGTSSVTGTGAAVNIETLVNGHSFFNPVFGDMTSTPHDSQQVVVKINNILSRCRTDCSFKYNSALTPSLTSAVADGSNLRITGERFSAVAGENTVKIGSYDCAVTAQTATELTCTPDAAGLGGKELTVVVYVKVSGKATGTATYKYTTAITGMTPTTGGISGLTEVTITGTHLFENVIVMVGDKEAKVISYNHNTVVFQSPKPDGTSAVSLSVVLKNKDSPSDQLTVGTFHYNPSLTTALLSVSLTTASVLGGETIVLKGTALGTSGSLVIGEKAATISVHTDTEVTATLPPMSPGVYDIKLTKTGESSPAALSDEIPKLKVDLYVQDYKPHRGGLFGGTMIIIIGKGFGTDSSKVKVVFGSIGCSITEMTDTMIKCRINDAGESKTITNGGATTTVSSGYAWEPQELSVHVGDFVEWSWTGQSSDNYDIFQTDKPDSVAKTGFSSGAPTSTGKFTYQIPKAGDYFYFSEAKGNEANKNMRGKIVATERPDFTRSLSVKVGDFEALYTYSAQTFPTPACSQAPHTCEANDPSNTEVGNVFYFKKCSTSKASSISKTEATHDDIIDITGERFGTEICQTEVFVDDKKCIVTSTTGGKISFKLNQEIEVASPKAVKVRVNSLGNTLMEDDSHITREAIVKSLSPTDGSISGGTMVTITGGGFFSPVYVLFGGQQAEIIESTHSEIKCKTKSVSAEGSVEITVLSKGKPAKCDEPCKNGFRMKAGLKVLKISGSDQIGLDAETAITFTGSEFGTDKTAVTVKIGDSDCTVDTVSDISVSCKISCIGPGDQAIAFSTTAGFAKFSSEVPKTASCAARVRSAAPLQGSKGGGTPITLSGCGFSDSTKIAFNGWDLDAVYDASAPCSLIVYPPSITTTKPASTASGAVDVGSLFSLDDSRTPSITTLSTANDQVTLSGSFLIASADNKVFIGRGGRADGAWSSFQFKHNHATAVTASQTTSQIVASIPKLPAGSYSVAVEIKDVGFSQIPASKITVNLDVTSVTPITGSTSGDYMIVVSGLGLYPDPEFTTVTLQCAGNDYQCPVKKEDSSSYDSIRCTVPKFTGSDTTECTVLIKVKSPVTGDSDVTNSAMKFTYDVSMTPSISAVEPRRGGTGGGTIITITGSNFGTDSSILTVTIDGVTCEVKSITDTEVTCQTGEHQGSVKSKVLFKLGSAGQASQENADFEYVNRWSSKFSWGGNDPPKDGEMVVIEKYTIVLDASSNILKLLLIKGGSLIFDDTGDIELSAEYILIMGGGQLQIGTEEKPYQNKATINLYGFLRTTELPIYGAKMLALREGKLDLHGRKIQNSWTHLADTADAASDIITLQKDVTDWRVGSEIIIATTGNRNSQRQTEKRIIKTIGADGKTLTLTEPLVYKHLGVTEMFDKGNGEKVSVELRAEVGLLTRNVKVRGVPDMAWKEITIPECEKGFNPGEFATQTCFQGRFGEETGSDQFGGHIIIHAPKPKTVPEEAPLVTAKIENIEVTYVGQAFRLGRYPIHFHLNGDASDSYVKSNSIHETFNRAVNIHGTHNLLVEGNVAYNVMGGAFFLEDGIEVNNIIQYNLAAFVKSSTSLLNDDITPANFWVTNPNNIIRHNTAVGGTHFGFWYRMHEHPDGPSFDPNICPQNTPIGTFANNTAHSMGWFGLWIFQHYFPTKDGKCNGVESIAAKFYTLTAWSCEKGAETVHTGGIQFIGFILLHNEKAGAETKFIGNSPQYPDMNSHMHKDCIIIARSAYLDAEKVWIGDGGTLVGVILGYGSGGQYIGNVFIGFDKDHVVAIGFTKIDGTCSVFCGGYTYYFIATIFVGNNPRKIKLEWLHQAVVVDVDGTLTGTKGNCVLPFMGTLPSSGCTEDSSVAYKPDDNSVTAGICEQEHCNFHRFSFNNILPSSMEAKDVIIVEGDEATSTKTTHAPFAKKRMTHKLGWMALLSNQKTYTVKFRDAEHMPNISYSATYYGFNTAEDNVIMCNRMDEQPDRFIANNKVESEFSATPLTISSAHLSVHYHEDKKSMCYMIKGGSAGRRRKRSLPTYHFDIPLSIQTYKCPFENCEWPDPSKKKIQCTDGTKTKMHWSSATWSSVRGSSCSADCDKEPGPGDTITIPSDIWMVLDKSVTVKKLVIDGTVDVLNEALSDYTLELTYLHIRKGQFLCGCKSTVFKGKFSIVLDGDVNTDAMDVENGPPAGSKVIMNNGIFVMNGEVPAVTWTHLDVTVEGGAKEITLTQQVDWAVGDEIVITGTEMIASFTETAKIASNTVQNGKSVLTLEEKLKNRHLAEKKTNPSYTMAAAVGLLTRKLKVIGKQYDGQEKDFFGARIITSKVAMTVDGIKADIPGVGQLTGVEMKRFGQLGFVESYDPRYGIAYVDVGVLEEEQFVKKCSFNEGYGIAIGVFGSKGVAIEDSVVYRCVGSYNKVYTLSLRQFILIKFKSNARQSNTFTFCYTFFINKSGGIGLKTDSENTKILNNLLTDALFEGTVGGREEKLFDYLGVVFAIKAKNLIMRNNTMANSERCGYHGIPEYCGGDDSKDCTVVNDATKWYGNIIHSSLIGICLLPTDTGMSTSEGVWQYSDFTIFRSFDFGVYYHHTPNIEMRRLTLIDNGAAIVPIVYGPDSVAHICKNKYVHIENVLIVGKSDSFTCEKDIVDTSTKLFTFSPLGRSYRVGSGQGGMTGITAPTMSKSGNMAPFKPFLNSKSYMAIGGKMTVKDVTFVNFGDDLSCGNPVAISLPPPIDDAIHPVIISGTKWINSKEKQKTYFSAPRLGVINPSDCVDMPCDGHKKAIIEDTDGTFTGTNVISSIVPFSGEDVWDVKGKERYGIGDYRVPKVMYYSPDDITTKLNPDQIYDIKGIVRDGCSEVTEWRAYKCPSAEYKILVIENMDSDTETRRLSPVALRATKTTASGGTEITEKTLDLINGPQDHGWCVGYTCQKRLSTFFALVRKGNEYSYEIFFTSTSPQRIRLRVLNAEESDKFLVSIYYNFKQILRTETSPMETDDTVEPTYVPAKNTQVVDGKEKFVVLSKEKYPSLSDACFTNFFDRDSSMQMAVVCGHKAVDIIVQNAVILQTTLAVVSIDDFFNSDAVINNLAGFLGIDSKNIRYMNPISENSRRKRSATSTITVLFEIGNNPSSSSETFTYDSLVELADKVINAIQTGNLSTALNVTIDSMAVSEVLPKDTDENWGKIVESENFLSDLQVPESLEILEPIQAGTEGNVFSTQPTLHFLDKEGKHVSLLGAAAYPWKIEASLRDGAGTNAAASLSGNTTVEFSSGYANFTDLGITHSGSGYIVDFTLTYPTGTSFTQASSELTVAKRSLKVVVASSSNTVYVGDLHSMRLEIHDKDTSVKVKDIAWSGASWNVVITKGDKSAYNGILSGTTSGTISPISGELIINDLALDTVGSEVVTVTVTSNPPGFTLTTDHLMVVYSSELKNVTIDTSQSLTVKVSGDYDTLGKTVFATAYMNKLMLVHPTVKFSNPTVAKGSILITMTIEGNSSTLQTMVTDICSDITSGSSFTYDAKTYTLSSSLQIDGTEYYGVNCGTPKDQKRDEKSKGGQEKLGVIIGVTVAVLTACLIVATALYWKFKIQPKTKTHKINGPAVYLGTAAPGEDILWREDSFMSIREKYLSDKPMPALSTSYDEVYNRKF